MRRRARSRLNGALANDGRVILALEFRRAVGCFYADPWALADADIPYGLAVPGCLVVQMRRARAGHVRNQRTISRSGSTAFSIFSPDGPVKSIWIVPSSKIRT